MAGALPRRISGFVQWLVRTPWPVFTLSQLQADIIGALLVLGFLRYGLPPEDRIELQELPALNLATFAGSVALLFLVGTDQRALAGAGVPVATPRQSARRHQPGRHRAGSEPCAANTISTAR